MENIKDEIDNLKTGFSKTISDVSDIVMERLKNPYIAAFSISWIICNWQPIAFFIFSKGTVEYKLNYISYHYSDILYYFLLPFSFSLIFLFLIPYLNVLNERFVAKAVKERNDNVKNQEIEKIDIETEIAKKLVSKEEAVKDARKLRQTNETINSLQKTNESLIVSLNIEKQKYSDLQTHSVAEYQRIREQYEVQIEELKETISKLDAEKQKNYEDHTKTTQDFLRIQEKQELEINQLKANIETMEINFSDEKSRTNEDWTIEKQSIIDLCNYEKSELENELQIVRTERDHFEKEATTIAFELNKCREGKS